MSNAVGALRDEQGTPLSDSAVRRLWAATAVAWTIAASAELWRESDGPGVVAFVVAGLLTGVLAAAGRLPSKVWYKDAGAEFAAAVAAEAEHLEEQVSTVSPETAEQILLSDLASTSDARSRAAFQVLRAVSAERSAERVLADTLKRHDVDFARDVLLSRGSGQNDWRGGNRPFSADFAFSSRGGRRVYVEVKAPSSPKGVPGLIYDLVRRIRLLEDEPIFICALPREAVPPAANRLLRGAPKVAEGASTVSRGSLFCVSSYEDESLAEAIELALTDKLRPGFTQGSFVTSV